MGYSDSKLCPRCGSLNPASSVDCTCSRDVMAGRTPPGLHYGGFWIRVAASMIDSGVIIGISLGGAAIFAAAGFFLNNTGEAAAVGYYLVWIASSWLYFAICESSSKQATFGKRAVGVVVTDSAGRPFSFRRASGRTFAKWLNALTLGVGWLVVAFSQRKQGLHDFVAGTMVLQRSERRKAGTVMVVSMCALAVMPVVGIVAAIAVPGFLRARIAGNEASAIGSLRAISRAQESYALQCHAYSPSLSVLRTAGNRLNSELTAANTAIQDGYQFTIGRTGERAINAVPGCEGSVTQFVATARPVSPGSTGSRFFAIGPSGVVYQDKSESFETATPLQ